MSDQLDPQSIRILICAFEGWNDAAESASSSIRLIAQQLRFETAAEIELEDYYDYQFTRPEVSLDSEGNRKLTWPSTKFLISNSKSPEESRFFLLLGTEPSHKWKAFAKEVVEMIEDREIDLVVFLGALLADAPHTRPIAVSATSQSARVRSELGVEASSYEGPVGIISVLSMALEESGIPSLSLWAAVPHYVHNPPSPKATLALLVELERLVGLKVSHQELAKEAFAWERGVDEMVESDDELAAYVSQLEKSRDELDSASASGETLAKELESFLRNQGRSPKRESGDDLS